MLKNYHKDRCYIVAEIGGNFTNFEEAKRLIDSAVECGVDAIKLQTYTADTVSSKKAMFDMENTGVVSQYDLFKKYQVDEDTHKAIFDYIHSKNLDWFSTPSHSSDLELLEKLDVCAYKVGSDDAVNIPFLKTLAKTQKTILLATGMCTMQEVIDSVDAILQEGNDCIILLHAITSYPTHAENVNLLAMQAMMRQFPELSVGYSDHTIGTTACICAAAMGASIIEKHFTHDKNADGPDHALSANPREMKEIVDKIREFETMKGNGIKCPAISERTTRINNRKSIVVIQDIKQGETITEKNIDIKRPGTGIQPCYYNEIIGRKANKDLFADDILMWGDC